MTRAPMRTVKTNTTTSPSICLAVRTLEYSSELETRLSNLGCRCVDATSFDHLLELLESEPPELAIVSLDDNVQCALEFCERHPKLLREVPVVFFTEDPSSCFEKSLAAVRLGAIDVLTPPFGYQKLEQISEIAHQQVRQSGNKSPQESGIEQAYDSVPEVLLRRGGANKDGTYTSDETPSRVFGKDSCTPIQRQASYSETSHRREVNAAVDRATFSPRTTLGPSTNEVCPQAAARSESQISKVKELESWILGSSAAMQSVRSIIAEVAETKANVMIYGASGTGKELVATAVHKLSNRASGRFEPVNMTEIPHDLAESLLFGHEKGAFTGADFRQIGVCEAADGGTLFLDEIGEMALATQPKLLRFLQEGTVKRIGSQAYKKVDVRVITATNRAPETIVKAGRLREDLFFRLHVVPIYIPPLQDRPEDIEQLAMLFLQRYVKAYKRTVIGFTKEVLDIFRLHDWPGNVRQLENVVERLVVFAKGRQIDVADIPAEIHAASMFGDAPRDAYPTKSSSVFVNTVPYTVDGQASEAANAIASMSAIQRTERAAIIEALQRSEGHVIDAANMLGLGQATVYRKIKQYHIPHQRRRRRRSPK